MTVEGGTQEGKSGRFAFVHLSDIHFSGYGPGAHFDVNSDIRRELFHDLAELVKQADASLDAIFIGGDIAGRGEEEEYHAATRWIDELCGAFDIAPEMVFCVPGNHDVYRPAIERDPVLRVAQRTLLSCALEDVDKLFEDLYTSEEHPGLMLRGLDHYNEFATRYLCGMKLDEHRWEWNQHFGRLRLHIVGLASALLCGPDDVQQAESSLLAIGPQARIPRYVDGTFTILMCHHPPNWLRDYGNVKPFMDRAHLQLYGHEHSFDLKQSGAGVRVDAGAVHPSRREDPWQPSYNLVSLRQEADDSKVVVDIYPRQLHPDQTFGPREEGEELRRQVISLAQTVEAVDPPLPTSPTPEPDPIEERTLARRFLDLDRDARLRIGKELALIGEADETLPEGVRIRKIFEQARAQNRLRDLGEKIND